MNRVFQKLRSIFRRKPPEPYKPPEPFICGTLLLRMAEDQAKKEAAENEERDGAKGSVENPHSIDDL
jgi:hypothetical protein